MKLLFYPDPEEYSQNISLEKPVGAVRKEIIKLVPKHKDLYLLVKDYLNKLVGITDLSLEYQREILFDLGCGLHEMRIPKIRRGGVFRIYFCYAVSNLGVLILLDAELKHDTKPKKTSSARDKLEDYKKWIGKGGQNEQLKRFL